MSFYLLVSLNNPPCYATQCRKYLIESIGSDHDFRDIPDLRGHGIFFIGCVGKKISEDIVMEEIVFLLQLYLFRGSCLKDGIMEDIHSKGFCEVLVLIGRGIPRNKCRTGNTGFHDCRFRPGDSVEDSRWIRTKCRPLQHIDIDHMTELMNEDFSEF